MATPETNRILFLTFHKCGSQWIRDVLTSHQILAHSGGFSVGHPGVHRDGRGRIKEWPSLPPKSFSGPFYGLSKSDWRERCKTGDKALIVLRDPRDISVSWLYSVVYSHQRGRATDVLREPMLALSPRGRLLLSIAFNPASRNFESIRSWMSGTGSSEYVTTYERLIADQRSEFQRILEFFGWPVPPEVRNQVLQEHSFESRSGRSPGEENVHSHFRRGVPGDWRNHFDRATGRIFEVSTPGLLRDLGYEKNRRWWEELPESLSGDEGAENAASERKFHELKAEVVRLHEENRMLQRICDERLAVIDGLLERGDAQAPEDHQP